MSQKKSREERRRLRELQGDRLDAFGAAARERDAELGRLRLLYEPKIQSLTAEYAAERQRIWSEWERRRDLIHQATILKPAAA